MSLKEKNLQVTLTNYFEKDDEFEPNSSKPLLPSGSITNTQLNTNYNRNKTDKADHRRTPPIVLNFIQFLKEIKCYNETIRNRYFVDICPYKCTRDNLNYSLWPANIFLFCNPPWSKCNVQKWMKELKAFVEIKKGSAALLTKIDCSVSNYWFDYLYNNDKIDVIKYELKNTFKYILPDGFKGNKNLKRAPRGSVLVIMQPRQENQPRKMEIHPKDLEKWKQSMSSNEYNELERRQQQHRNMDDNYFRNDNENSKVIEKNNKPNTLTQMGYITEYNRNHNVKDNGIQQLDDDDSDIEIIENTNNKEIQEIIDDISDEGNNSNEFLEENKVKKNRKKRKRNNETDFDMEIIKDTNKKTLETNDDISDGNNNNSSNAPLVRNKLKRKKGKKRKRNRDYCKGNAVKKRRINENTNIAINVSISRMSSSSEDDCYSEEDKTFDAGTGDIDSQIFNQTVP